jgi:50S ribosomal protein L16 3-hydroxylase
MSHRNYKIRVDIIPTMRERLPGGMAASEFLRRHWQRKPLVVRNAIPGIGAGPGKRKLFALARRADVEARLVSRRNGRWSVWPGPLGRTQLARQPARNWTLLVHGVNHHCTAVERLLRRFSFLPQARLDDVMMSYATPGGGVGAHYDRYDVFLVQGYGRRVWRLERKRRFVDVPGAPLRLIADFAPQEEYLLEPGDMLYVPPGWGHDGVALEPSFTYSIGFRAPRVAELAVALLDDLQDRGFSEREYRDPGLRIARRPGQIGSQMLRFAEDAVRAVRWTRAQAHACLARFLTTPKQHVVFERPARPRSRARFLAELRSGAVRLDPRTQLLYYGRRFFINGEEVRPHRTQARSLAQLADRRTTGGRALARSGAGDLLYGWYQDGYLDLERAT